MDNRDPFGGIFPAEGLSSPLDTSRFRIGTTRDRRESVFPFVVSPVEPRAVERGMEDEAALPNRWREID